MTDANDACENAASENDAPAPEPEPQLTVYLASASPRRRQLLEEAGVVFTVRVPAAAVDESLTADEAADPYNAVKLVAQRKAAALVEELLDEGIAGATVVIGSDTMVVKGLEIFGKPTDAADAERMLRALSGCTHQVMTGVSVWILLPVPGADPADPEGVQMGYRSFTDESQVTFRTLTDEDIAAYLATGESFDKAGAYAIQGGAAAFVRSVQGAMDTIIGLPVQRLLRDFPELVSDDDEDDAEDAAAVAVDVAGN